MKLKLNNLALFFGLISVIASLVIVSLAYTKSVNIAEKNLYQYYSNKAQHIHAIIETNIDKSDEELLQLIEEVYNLQTDRPDDEYICLVNENSELILHSKHPNTVGANAGKNLIINEREEKFTLNDLVGDKINFTGNYISSKGQKQIAAFNFCESKNWTIGVHRSKEMLQKEIKSQYAWIVIALLIIGLLLIPLSFLSLFLLTKLSHQRKMEAEKQIQNQIREAKEKVEKQEARHSAMIANISDVIGIIDKDGCIAYKSPNIEKSFGWNQHELIGEEWSVAVHPDDKERIAEALYSLAEDINKVKKVEYRYRCKNGEYKYVQFTAINLAHNPVINGVLTNYHDITERKKYEQKIQLQNEQLKELNHTKDKFFSIISHDLRGPLSALFSFSELLAENYDQYDVAKQKELLSFINKGHQTTLKMLDNLLLWSRSQRGIIQFKPKTINLYSLAGEILEPMYQMAENKNISLINTIPEDIAVTADKDLLTIIIRNLITNAIKYTHKGGNVSIVAHLNADNENENYTQISVIDNGVGISLAIQAKLFLITETQSTEGTENESGTGLGLILCKEFTEMHKGKIWVESEEEKGSKFSFSLPINI